MTVPSFPAVSLINAIILSVLLVHHSLGFCVFENPRRLPTLACKEAILQDWLSCQQHGGRDHYGIVESNTPGTLWKRRIMWWNVNCAQIPFPAAFSNRLCIGGPHSKRPRQKYSWDIWGCWHCLGRWLGVHMTSSQRLRPIVEGRTLVQGRWESGWEYKNLPCSQLCFRYNADGACENGKVKTFGQERKQ